jgi:hypothetical protein
LMSASLKPNGFPAAIPNHVGFTVRYGRKNSRNSSA